MLSLLRRSILSSMPLAPLTVLSTLLHALIALRVLPALADFTPWWPVLGLLLVVSAATMPLPFLSRRRGGEARPPLPEWLKWVGLISMGWFSTLLMLTLLRDAVLFGTWIVTVLGGLAVDWPRWQQWSAAAVPLAATAISLIGFVNARRTAGVKRVRVPIVALPAGLEGFTIAQLSDIHVSPTIRRGYIQRIVDAVNQLEADMVAITGDIVDGTVPELRDHVAPLGRLKARHGSFAVTGNHEYYAGAHAWIDELRRIGLRVLLNEHVVLHRRSARGAQTDEEAFESAIVVAGVTDFSAVQFDASHASDPQAALRGAPQGVQMRVLLAHQPRSAPAAAAAGFQLQLSGHTHGGQFVPWGWFVRFQQPFTAGLNRLGAMWVYVSRGTGYWGPPKRFGAPSEITLLTLVSDTR